MRASEFEHFVLGAALVLIAGVLQVVGLFDAIAQCFFSVAHWFVKAPTLWPL